MARLLSTIVGAGWVPLRSDDKQFRASYANFRNEVLAGEYLAAHLDSARRDLPLRIGVLQCDILSDTCNDRYLGFTAASNSAAIHWRLSDILEGWNETNAPPAAAKLLADDPAIDVLWAENGAGTKALTLTAASLPRPIIVLGTDRSRG